MNAPYYYLPFALVAAAALARGQEPPAPPPAFAPGVLVLRDGNVVEGDVAVGPGGYRVRAAGQERTLPADAVRFHAAGRDDAVKFFAAPIAPGDAAGRVKLGQWCAVNGLREAALEHASDALRLKPAAPAALALAASMEESLRRFPANGAKPAAKADGDVKQATFEVVEAAPEVPAEAYSLFATRVQPVLTNLCVSCHAKPDHAGAFKMTRTPGLDAGPRATRANLLAALTQVRKDDPANSPLLVKAASAHGGMKLPVLSGRAAPAYQSLLMWVAVAAPSGTAPSADPPRPQATPQLPPAAPAAEPRKLPPLPASVPMPQEPSTEPPDEFDPTAFNRNR